MEEAMFGSDGIQCLQRAAKAESRQRSAERSPLPLEDFPLQARGRDIVTDRGIVVATAADPLISEEITRRLNNSYWREQEDQWAF
jgi:hypothetical protein